MKKYNYEQSIWGKGEASLSWFSPTSFRLRQSLKAIKNLKAGDRVLEVGCGAGQFIQAIKKLRPELECCGCDISEKALDEAGKNRGSVKYDLLSDGGKSSFPYQDNNFQAILIYDVLEHVEDVDKMLQEINRVLEPNGIFYLNIPCEGDILSVWHLLEKLKITSNLTKKYAGHIQKFSRKSLKKLVSKYNFGIIHTRYSEHFLGQLLGVAVFMLMDRAARKSNVKQMNNEQFFSGVNKKKGGLFSVFKKVINLLVNLENILFFWLPSPNVHIALKHCNTKTLQHLNT